SMDVFSLPDVFLRKLMKTMGITDRLMLRRTCRAFEKLVAETHVGFFDFLDDQTSTLEFIRKFTNNWKIEYITFTSNNATQL
ncbi:hypothetical protein PENTCL1PPCAC_20451, partial [Pristionchus entomophagus]